MRPENLFPICDHSFQDPAADEHSLTHGGPVTNPPISKDFVSHREFFIVLVDDHAEIKRRDRQRSRPRPHCIVPQDGFDLDPVSLSHGHDGSP